MTFYGLTIDAARQTLTRMEMHRNYENECLSKIKAKFAGLYSCYSGDNHNLSQDVALAITNKIPKIKNMHDKNAFVIRKNITNYIEQAKDVAEEL